jgi:hypothetical protein
MITMMTFAMEQILQSIYRRAESRPGTFVGITDIAADTRTSADDLIDQCRYLKEQGLLQDTTGNNQFALSSGGAAWCRERS